VDRTIVIDEDLDHRIARDLRERGRKATSHKTLGTTHLLDGEMLERLAVLDYPWVLVTGDDAMPAEHAATIARIGATIATIDGEWEACCEANGLILTQDQFAKETIQRWAHVIAAQDAGSVRRYTPKKASAWKARRQHAQ